MSELEHHCVAFGAHKNTVNLLPWLLSHCCNKIPDESNKRKEEERKGGRGKKVREVRREENSRNIKQLLRTDAAVQLLQHCCPHLP